MIELLWLLPICFTVAVVLGACRGSSYGKILLEALKSFGKIVVGIFVICVVLQLVLLLIPPLS
ncbi:MAG: hypothetical protein ABFS86_04475 [Planctomycetota bacterium]